MPQLVDILLFTTRERLAFSLSLEPERSIPFSELHIRPRADTEAVLVGLLYYGMNRRKR